MRDVASQRHKRTMRGALAAGAVIAAVGLAPSATAAPPGNNNDPMQNYQQLSQQAAQLGEQINNAQADLNNKNAQVAKATGDIANAKAAEQTALQQENQFRGQVDELTDASFEGARMSQLSALLTGTSAKDFLNKAEDLQALAADNFAVLDQYNKAITAAQAAQTRGEQDQKTAQQAADAAQTLLNQLNQQKQQLTQQLAQANAALHQLSAQQQHAVSTDTGPQGSFIAPPGIAGAAMNVALAQRGKPYQWAGSGPNSFDCSGLVDYAYAQAGYPGLPHSSEALQTMGVADPTPQVGDLVFFGNPAGHVGIYVGNNEMVDAPYTGAVVRIDPLYSGFSGARRLGS
jgi:cell wall-associated NlpC family hydrolase